MYKNGLIKKIRLISKFMSQLGYQTIAILILPNISRRRRRSNQTMKFGRLIKHDMRNIFLEKTCAKMKRKNEKRPRTSLFVSSSA